jgi:hypothetical protein
MASSGMLRRVALVRTDVSKDFRAPIMMTRSGNLGTPIVVTSRVRRLLVTAKVVPSLPILVTLMMEAIRSYKTTVLKRATRHNIPEDDILHSHRCKNLISYISTNSSKSIHTFKNK